MVKIEFIPNDDGITTTMLVDSQVLDPAHRDIPYVPERLVDSRGIALHLFCGERRLNLETDIEFVGNSWDERDEIKRLYNYLKNPVYVRETIIQIDKQKSKSKSYSN